MAPSGGYHTRTHTEASDPGPVRSLASAPDQRTAAGIGKHLRPEANREGPVISGCRLSGTDGEQDGGWGGTEAWQAQCGIVPRAMGSSDTSLSSRNKVRQYSFVTITGQVWYVTLLHRLVSYLSKLFSTSSCPKHSSKVAENGWGSQHHAFHPILVASPFHPLPLRIIWFSGLESDLNQRQA